MMKMRINGKSFLEKALPARAGEDTQRRAAGRVAVFFLVMLALTLFSRGMAGAALARVTVAAPQGGTVTEEVHLSGQLESQNVRTLTLPAGLRVESVLTAEGQQAEKGETLLTLEEASLEQAITRAGGELEELQVELAACQRPQETDDSALQSAQKGYQRAKEDAAADAERQETLVSRARKAVRAAEKQVSQIKSDQKTLRKRKKELQEAIREAEKREQELQEALAQAEPSDADGSASGSAPEEAGELEKQLSDVRAELEEDRQALSQTEEALEGGKDTLESAQQQLSGARDALEDAKTAAAESGRSAKRAKEDAQSALDEAQRAYDGALQEAQQQEGKDQAQAQILSASIAEKEAQIKTLRALQEAGNALKAPCAGKVVSLQAEAGGASEEVRLRLSVRGDGYILRIDFGEEEADDLQTGAELLVEQEEQSGQTELAALNRGEESVIATAYLSGGEWRDGPVEVSVVRSSDYYETTVPIAAYHSDNMGGFVYVVEERETVLGLQYLLKRENVELLANDGQRAAVSGLLDAQSQVVTSSTRSIQEGERVRFA